MMKIIKHIKNVLFGRNSDYISDEKGNDMYSLHFMNYNRRLNNFLSCIPTLLGAALGCAIAKAFSLDTSGYYVLAIIFAIVAGTVKSYEFDKKPFVRALLENIAFVGIVAILFRLSM